MQYRDSNSCSTINCTPLSIQILLFQYNVGVQKLTRELGNYKNKWPKSLGTTNYSEQTQVRVVCVCGFFFSFLRKGESPNGSDLRPHEIQGDPVRVLNPSIRTDSFIRMALVCSQVAPAGPPSAPRVQVRVVRYGLTIFSL